jgi:predicted PurR-regulated permease PerM
MNRLFTPLQQLLVTWILILMTGWLTLNALRYFSELISVLVTAGLIAFLLSYPVRLLQELMPRGLATGVIYLMVGGLVALVRITIAPPVFNQAQQLLTDLPELIESGQEQVTELQA